MKNFKAQTIDTPGVIKKVSELFRGYRRLILGFNTFLPEGHKICDEDIERSEAAFRAAEEAARARELAAQQAALARGPPSGPVSSNQNGGGGAQGGQAAAAGGAAPQHQEFDHAISYVTNIKQRFSTEPDTYKAFLDILHAYQKDQAKPKEQQKGIQEVLDKVSKLFADHPDLLKEFTYFLPDAVQGQAKERLDRAAQESIDRKRRQQQMGQMPQARPAAGGRGGRGGRGGGRGGGGRGGGMNQGGAPAYGGPGGGGGGAYGRHGGYDDDGLGGYGQDYDPRKRQSVGGGARHGGAQGGDLNRRPMKKPRSAVLDSLHATSIERYFFERAAQVLADVSPSAWGEFTQCLSLYSAGVLSAADLLSLVSDQLEGTQSSELLDEFKVILSFHSTSQFANQAWAQLPVTELDLSSCRRCTPSYRALPASYPKLVCSKRSELEKANLNDEWVSVPMGSEESFVFKHMRKNQYEEELFKNEDQRFEMDMVIEANKATLQKLQPLLEEINEMKALAAGGGPNGPSGQPLNRYRFRLDERSLSTVHLAAIARIYGDHADDLLALLRKHPIGAIPVIHKRLEQKDAEWRKARQAKIKEWRPVLAANFGKALDHQREAFRVRDKKLVTAHALASEVVDASLVKLESAQSSDSATAPEDGAAAAAASEGGSGKASPPNTTTNAHGAAGAALLGLNGVTSDKELAAELSAKLARLPPGFGTPKADAAAAAADSTAAHGNGNASGHLVLSLGDKALAWEAYLLVRLALAKGAVSQTNSQKVLAAWRELLVDFFGIPWACLSHKSTLPSSSEASSSSSSSDVVVSPEAEEAPLPVGTSVICPDGWAKTTAAAIATSDGDTYELQLASDGSIVTRPASQVWAQTLPPPESPPPPLEPEKKVGSARWPAANSAAAASGGADAGSSEDAAAAWEGYAEPLEGLGEALPASRRMLVATQPGFLAMRLFALLCERLALAKDLCEKADATRVEEHPLKASVREEQADPEKAALAEINGTSKDLDAGSSLGLGAESKTSAADGGASGDGEARDSSSSSAAASSSSAGAESQGGFEGWLELLASLLGGRIDANRYEDGCRDLVGAQAYLLSTADKVVASVVKALQALVADRHYTGLVKMYQWESTQGSGGGNVQPARYLCHAQQQLAPLPATPGSEAYRMECDHEARTLTIDALGFATPAVASSPPAAASSGAAGASTATTAPPASTSSPDDASPPLSEAGAEATEAAATATAGSAEAAHMEEATVPAMAAAAASEVTPAFSSAVEEDEAGR